MAQQDIDDEKQLFENASTTSLVGSSIRGDSAIKGDSSDVSAANSRSSSRPNLKTKVALHHQPSLVDLHDEGALLNGDEYQDISEILDDTGHVKNEVPEPPSEALSSKGPSLRNLAMINQAEDKADSPFNERDEDFLAPASSRDGSRVRSETSSALDEAELGENIATQRYSPRDHSSHPLRPGSGMMQPHLARGDSCHSTVTNNDFSSTPPLNIGERRPRHAQGQISSSSMNYLRSISRSRSRAANDTRSLNDNRAMGVGKNQSESELKEEGALVTDSYEQLPDLEQAVNDALKIVESHDELPQRKRLAGKEVPNEKDFENEENPETQEENDSLSESKTKHVPEEPEEESEKKPEKEFEKEPSQVDHKKSDNELAKEIVEEEEKYDRPSSYVPKRDKLTFEDEPVFLFTSFAGGFQVASRTQRLTTILAANKVEFTMRDLGTDEDAKKIWKRYSQGKTLPGIVRSRDDYIGNWEDLENANENYEVRSLIYETV